MGEFQQFLVKVYHYVPSRTSIKSNRNRGESYQ
jgi:hypothetical protein